MVDGLGHGHLRALDGGEEAVEEHHDVDVIDVAAGVENQGRIGAKIHSISANRRRQR